ncbi:MAG: DUF424 family protein [Candidatus Thermoplasmatota archaeon]|nr:DUF424 family protein [Candidatus Thermoplasmatota archaeon]
MISLRVYRKGENVLLAACDAELLNKKISSSKFELEVGEFYRDKLVNEERFLAHLELATIINLVGKKVVSLAVKAGLVDKENVIVINKIPHAQAVKVII